MDMLDHIRQDTRETRFDTGRDCLAADVLQVMEDVPRHLFVPQDYAAYSYINRPLPIGYGQTISQPFIVALMTDFLNLKKNHIVLEIGTGSGYQTAILSGLVKQVCSIEIIPELGCAAKKRLQALGYDNVTVHVGDGHQGWDEDTLFDEIIVTAAADKVPPLLLKQLKPDGRMLIPIDTHQYAQDLLLLKKHHDSTISTRKILSVRFVPLTGVH